MSTWLTAELALLPGFILCAWLIVRSKNVADWLVALQMAGVISIFALVILAEAMSRPSFYDLGLALTILSFPSGLLFAHFVQRWFR